MDSSKYTSFSKSQIRRLLKTHGSMLAFSRRGVNDFKEPTDTVETIEVIGLLHQSKGFISRISTEGSQTRTDPITQILVSYEDATKLKTDDCINIGGLSYRITGFNSFGSSGVASDISLEVYDDWAN